MQHRKPVINRGKKGEAIVAIRLYFWGVSYFSPSPFLPMKMGQGRLYWTIWREVSHCLTPHLHFRSWKRLITNCTSAKLPMISFLQLMTALAGGQLEHLCAGTSCSSPLPSHRRALYSAWLSGGKNSFVGIDLGSGFFDVVLSSSLSRNLGNY